MSKENRRVLTGSHYYTGNDAACEGALAAGLKFFAGYPITPSSELAERMSRRLPKLGGIFIQMEDELASMCALVGASWGGVKSMTCTSGPGFSLMQENIGLAAMMEAPCVVLNVQRGGPSTGLPTIIGQGDVMQARWGSHGDYEIIALSPNSPQECFDLTIEAFNFSEKYRVPAIFLMDECVGHMTERVVIPKESEIKLIERKRARGKKENYLPFKADKTLVPPMVSAGEGYNVHITGLTHDEKGYPVINAEAQEPLVRRLCDKIRNNADDITMLEENGLDDAEIVLIAYGATSRSARSAMRFAREKGIKVGLLRFITIWPFPEKFIKELAEKIKAFVVAEVNYGQIALEVERCAGGKAETYLVQKMGGALHTPQEIMDKIMEVAT